MYIFLCYNFFLAFMSVFKTQWIVLQVGKYSQEELWYKIFFKDYGILTVKKKKKSRERPIDTGYYISCEIITSNKQNIHTIGNIKTKCFFVSENRSFSEIELFLELIKYIKTELPEWNPHYELYEVITKYIEHCEHYSLLLTYIKVMQTLGNLPESHPDQTIQKILKFMHTHHYKDIMRLKDIPEDIQKKLEQML